MVSNSVVSRIGLRWPIHAFIATAIFAVLYKQWLTTPVLQYVSIGRWRLLAVVVAAACGGVLSLLRFSTLALEQWLAYCWAELGLRGRLLTMWRFRSITPLRAIWNPSGEKS